jgi:protein SCO1/2
LVLPYRNRRKHSDHYKAVGYKFKPQGVDFAHPSVIIMISPEGKITRYLYGLTYLPFDVKMAAIEAQKGLPQPSINKFLEVCFAYDPQGRTYTLQVTRIVGFLSIVIALIILTSLLIRGRRKTIKVENNGVNKIHTHTKVTSNIRVGSKALCRG